MYIFIYYNIFFLEIASEQMIFELIKNKETAKTMKSILIQNFKANPKSFECKGFDDIYKEDNNEIDNKEKIKESMTVNTFSKNNNKNNPENDYNHNNKECIPLKENIFLQSKRPRLSEKENISNNIDNINQKNNSPLLPTSPILLEKITIQLPSELIDDNINCLNFELFILKWERILFLNTQTILSLNQLTSLLNLVTLKSSPFLPITKHNVTGSFLTQTLHSNHKEIDYLIQLSSLPEDLFEKFIDNSYNDIINQNCVINFIREKENENSSPYIQITNKADEICRVFFIKESLAQNINEHLIVVNKIKLTVEQIIAIKFLKEWRRNKDLLFFKGEAIEFIIMKINYEKIYEIIFAFYQFVLNEFSDEKFELRYQKEIIKDIKTHINFNKLKQEVINALNYIKESKYDCLF